MPAKKRGSKRAWVDPDDAPEWTQDQFNRAEVAVGGKVVQPAQGTLTRPRGRPKKPDAKVHTHIRLSPQVLRHFRGTGPGWQTRIDEVLQKWVKKHRKESHLRRARAAS
ncbi:MAG: BrnA antitoxin family protein [Pseudorhodoplanes sp.]|nr:BrnA antitoxin family protein [Pseudorhodoplanes sp.]